MQHTPTVTEVPPADSIGRHLCEVVCSCGLFRTATSGIDAASARADAIRAFDTHRERGSSADPLPPRVRPALATVRQPTPARRRRLLPILATPAVVAIVGGAVLAVIVLNGSQSGGRYDGARTLVGGPDRTGPAVIGQREEVAPVPEAEGDRTARLDGYDTLRAEVPDFVLWSDLDFDRAIELVCGSPEEVDVLKAEGLDDAAIDALVDFACQDAP